MSIAEALETVRAQLQDAAHAAGRDPKAVQLLAVSKRKPVQDIVAAYEAGQRDFGENYGQELLTKAAELSHLEGLRWHHIGHLQRNKVKPLVPVTALLHGVDRPSLVQELDKRAAAAGRRLEVLIQVNVAGEQSKSGCTPGELTALLDAIASSEHVVARGLMTMPPYVDDPEEARPHFARLRELRDQHGGPSQLPELSMGMTHDYAVAVAEGATIVRIGTAIFGARP